MKAVEGKEATYDFDLMMGAGHLTGYTVDDEKLLNQVGDALAKLAEPAEKDSSNGSSQTGESDLRRDVSMPTLLGRNLLKCECPR